MVNILLIFLINFLVGHVRLYVVSYQKLYITHVLYTSPLLKTVLAETDLTVYGSHVLHLTKLIDCSMSLFVILFIFIGDNASATTLVVPGLYIIFGV